MPVHRDPSLGGGRRSNKKRRVSDRRLPESPPITRRIRRGNRQVDTLVSLEAGQKYRRSLPAAGYPPAPIECQCQRRAKVWPHRRGGQVKVGTPLCAGQAVVLYPGLAKVCRIPVTDERRVFAPNVAKCFSL